MRCKCPGQADTVLPQALARRHSTANSSVTIRCIETDQEWTIPLTANTVAWSTSVSMPVLDKSGSMEWDSGIPGQRRVDVLQSAAPVFVDMLPGNDAIGVVAFDLDPTPVMPVTLAGAPVIGAGRIAAKTAINNHTPNPAGGTSIGQGQALLADPGRGYQWPDSGRPGDHSAAGISSSRSLPAGRGRLLQ